MEKPDTHVPEWEHEAAANGESNSKAKQKQSTSALLSEKLDRVLPPHKRYLRLSRNAFLWVVLGTILALLALIIGLAAGLTAGSG
jgi:hypothetical protein